MKELTLGQILYRVDTQHKVIARFICQHNQIYGDIVEVELKEEPIIFNQMAADISLQKALNSSSRTDERRG